MQTPHPLSRSSLALLVVVVLLGAPNAGEATGRDAQRSVTVLSANLLYCNPLTESKRSYLDRRARLIELLARLRPDVIAFQEASECLFYHPPERTARAVAAELARHGLDYRQSFWASEEIPGIWREGLAFLWNRRTVTVDPAEVRCLHLTPTYRHHGLRITKSLCRVRLRPADTTRCRPLTLVNTHLDARRRSVRDEQADEVARRLSGWLGPSSPAILVGDLNDRRMTPRFEESGWSSVIQRGVDYVLAWRATRDDVVGVRVVPLVEPGISDHDGLLTTLRWRCER